MYSIATDSCAGSVVELPMSADGQPMYQGRGIAVDRHGTVFVSHSTDEYPGNNVLAWAPSYYQDAPAFVFAGRSDSQASMYEPCQPDDCDALIGPSGLCVQVGADGKERLLICDGGSRVMAIDRIEFV